MTIRNALLQATELLDEAGIAVPRLTAEVLLRHALGGVEQVYLYAHDERELTELEWLHFGRYLHERMGGKPTQYITRHQEFYGREFQVTADVLIPRPETEHVVEVALGLMQGAAPGARSVLDVGTGSGALAVTLALELGVRSWATDISPAALAVARGNAASLGARVEFTACDLMAAIGTGSMDLIVSNPPYVPLTQREGLQREVRDFEPHVALFGGQTGFELYERLIGDAPRVLKPWGWLILELGFGSLGRVQEMLAGWEDVQLSPDLAGIPRVIAARRATL